MSQKIPLIVVVGPTGAGKSRLADFLASRCNGVIINADARQVYQDISIVSAAPIDTTNALLYGSVPIGVPYSVGQYVQDADEAIRSVYENGKVPIVVGGTGLYVEHLCERKELPPPVDEDVRSLVNELTHDERLEELRIRDPEILSTIDIQNPRRVGRALEVVLQTGKSISTFGNTVDTPYEVRYIGWTADRNQLERFIEHRIDEMLAGGAIAEVARLIQEGHGLDESGMEAIGISEIASYIVGESSYEEMRREFIIHTRQYAKRQMTWFKRNDRIVWYTSYDEVWLSVQDFLHKNFSQFYSQPLEQMPKE